MTNLPNQPDPADVHGCSRPAEVRIDTPTVTGYFCYEHAALLTGVGGLVGLDVLSAGTGRSCDGPGPDRVGTADVFGGDHPVIGEAIAWLENTDTVPLTRATAETLLPHWPHYPNLTDRERAGILARFPDVTAAQIRQASVEFETVEIGQSLADLGTVAQGDCAISDLAVGDWFADPSREDNRPAKVVEILSIRDGRAFFTLDDYTRYGVWTGSYPLDATVKLIDPDRGVQLDREAAQTKAAEAEYRRRLDAFKGDA